ncbi:MAG: HAD-IA family hydrolase [Dehalococcoidia bacterium]|nr:HAD-IA family hydrolase [Dehalococcoidia bacterium]
MHPPRTVCLDFDRTLGFMAAGNFSLYLRAAEECGVSVTEEQLAARPLEDAWEQWMTPEGPAHLDASVDEASFRRLREALHRARIRAAGIECDDATLGRIGARVAALEGEAVHYRLYDDAVPGLERLARAGLQAVVVSNHVWQLPEIMRALGCGARFEGVVTSARVGYRKPHPEIFRAALRLSGSAPEDALMVGDSLSADVSGAQAAGLRAVLLDRSGEHPPVEGVTVIRSLVDIPLTWT